MTDHSHHGHDNVSDKWAQQHLEKGQFRELQLAPATRALLRTAGVKPGSRVLDVACGAGDTAAAATATGAEATGIDTSRAMIQIARDRFPKTRFEEASMLSPPPGPWDAVLCRLGAHHADDAWMVAAFDVLAPNGRIALAERDAVDAESRKNGMKRLTEWTDLLQQTGFIEPQTTPSGADLNGPIYIISGQKPAAPRP